MKASRLYSWHKYTAITIYFSTSINWQQESQTGIKHISWRLQSVARWPAGSKDTNRADWNDSLAYLKISSSSASCRMYKTMAVWLNKMAKLCEWFNKTSVDLSHKSNVECYQLDVDMEVLLSSDITTVPHEVKNAVCVNTKHTQIQVTQTPMVKGCLDIVW